MNQMLLPKNHIINIAQMEQFQCAICYSIETELVRCKGPCKKVFCLHCVTRFKVKSSQCPNRCSNPCEVQSISNLSIQFKCPYENQNCKQILHGTNQFHAHTQSCDYIYQEIKEEMIKRKEFVCPKNHRLLFLNPDTFKQIYKQNNFYQVTLNQICKLCSLQTMCSSICKECSTEQKKCVFCFKCRALPCTKTKCPVGHSYIVRSVTSGSTVCDFCGLAISIFGSKSYKDQNCNFDICEGCHNKLPQTHPLVPLIQNIPTKKESFLQQIFNNVLNGGIMHPFNNQQQQLSSEQQGFLPIVPNLHPIQQDYNDEQQQQEIMFDDFQIYQNEQN